MKKKLRIRISKMTLATSLIILSGLCGFAGVAISATEDSRSEEIADGSNIELTPGLSLTPIKGWLLERKAAGMTLVMKEVTPTNGATPTDYSKPIFARNISLMTLSKARPIDAKSIDELKLEISKMIIRDSYLSDFAFTEAKLFDYKEKNDGVVLFSQLTVNNYQMMQMQIVVSGGDKSYLLTYSDLASNFANPATFDAAWKSMTSVTVPGTAPKRYHQEMLLGGALSGGFLALVVPFFLIRWRSTRKIRKLAEELQYDWDHGALKTDADYELSEIGQLEQTRTIKRRGQNQQVPGSSHDSTLCSSMALMPNKTSFESSVDSFSTRHSRFG
jgi:hypothetical protein